MSRYYAPVRNEGTLHSLGDEKDACGVGFVTHIHGQRSHRILRMALESVCNMTHRGAVDADQKTGDGAGVLTQIPYNILLPAAEEMGARPGDRKNLGVGVMFLPTDRAEQIKAKILCEGILRNRGCAVYGWREVPVNPRQLGEKARETMPAIFHLLVGRPDGLDDDSYERRLYLVRREIEIKAKSESVPNVYSSSFSHRTISYKALLVATALEKFYQDLQNDAYETAIALYHQRYSTNTFPTWALGQPFRMLAHNGEINTLRGNRNWMGSRERDFAHEVWGEDVRLLQNLIDPEGSDSMSLDQALELLVLSGRSLEHAMSILVPPAWRIDPTTSEAVKDYYRFHRLVSEPWDGPAALVYTDGVKVAASLDRNGLRPSRFKVYDGGIFDLGSEVGTVEVDASKVVKKGRLAPGQMVVVDTAAGTVSYDKEIKARLASMRPYGEWIRKNRVSLKRGKPQPAEAEIDVLTLSQKQVSFGYTQEELDMAFVPMLATGAEAIYSMGDSVSLSVLSKQPRLLYTYFKQLFAQVTNPPIDPIRERGVMSLSVALGWQRNLLAETPEHAKLIHLETPFLFNNELDEIKAMADFPHREIDITWPAQEGEEGLERAVTRICEQANAAVEEGVRILILTDRGVDHNRVAVPALLATGAVHHHLNRTGIRMRCGIVVETGEARDTHQMACLFGFGAQAVCPYLAFETIQELIEEDKLAKKPKLTGVDYTMALKNFRGGLEKGVLKVMSKMGISVLTSYQGAQIFEAIGLGHELVGRCFTGTASRIAGIGFAEVGRDCLRRHTAGFGTPVPDGKPLKLEDPGYYRWRRDAEVHMIGGPSIKPFHAFVRDNDPAKYKEYVDQTLASDPVALHDLFEFVPDARGGIPIDDVEPIEDIRIRFTTAAMSLGAISPEAHEALAIAMNMIGGKSDSGEGGEDPARFNTLKNSKIKQVASGRFGVSAEYLANAEELEIKMAQGAKPGEGGQLPAHKVVGIIAKLRHTQPGVQLISPPPHHDIYSIEDLAQLIHDLKEVNPRARICVKLVSSSGVGTVAAGVAKANADIILISGHEGGTGASPLSSIKHAGLPWELGLAATQQTLMLNGLRDRVTLRTDGGFKNGRDVVMGALLGAEEFNFGTVALIALGCVYVRQCHLNTCPVGVATQNPELRKKFKGKPEHVVNFFNAVAQEARGIMAKLGVRKMDDLIGRTRFLRQRVVEDHPKAAMLDLSPILRDVGAESGEDMPRRCFFNRNDGVHAHPLDDKILQQAHDAIQKKHPMELSYKVRNTNRNVGTKLSGEIAYIHGNQGLPEGTITLNLTGSAGQSFGTFLCSGIRMILTGEANDYVGKGMSGGEIIIRPSAGVSFNSWENSILGNTVMYGATGGRLFAAGLAGERFCVRNSGGTAVVEGIGDHGCEYMTNGTVVVLGRIGNNFGAGMSGGVAYLLDEESVFDLMHNPEMIHRVPMEGSDVEVLQDLIRRHLEVTESARAKDILERWDHFGPLFVKVEPTEKPKPAEEEKTEEGAAEEAGEEVSVK